MNQASFDNRLRALFNIDGNRLPEFSDDQYIRFRQDPVRFWLVCDDPTRAIIWREVQHRCIAWDKPEVSDV
jgi:hypothetical protein